MVDINKNPPWFRTAEKCRYSNLPVSYPDIFVSRHPGTNYFVDAAKLGDRILLVKGSGNVRSYEMADALRFMDEYVSKYFDMTTGLFLIENYADIGRVDFKARKLYIDHHKNSDVFWGGVFYKMSLIMRISFRISQRLHIQDKDVYAVDSFKQAISLAMKIIDQRSPGHIFNDDTEFGDQSVLVSTSTAVGTLFDYAAGKLRNLKHKLIYRSSVNSTRQYSEALLKYIESIDWQKDGSPAPATKDSADKSVKKVFDAISFIKSEIDDLLKEKEAAARILQESETRYRRLVEHAKAGILEFDYQTNRITSVNDALADITGYSKEELFLMDPLDLLTKESQEKFTQRFSRRFSGETVSPDMIYALVTKSGHKKWILFHVNVMYEDGRLMKADAVISDITRLKAVENQLMNYQTKLKRLSIKLSRTEETQRRELASRLHESVSQELFVAQLKLNTLEKSLDNPEHIRQLDAVKAQIVKSIMEIKGITYDLSPPVLYDLGLKEAVESLAKSCRSRYRVSIKTRFGGCLDDIELEIKIIIYRIIKEIIHNSIKHGRAEFLNIMINTVNHLLKVEVTDNGAGFDVSTLADAPYAGDGFGLFDIREKINHLGGILRITSTPDCGTRVGLSVPLQDSEYPVLNN